MELDLSLETHQVPDEVEIEGIKFKMIDPTLDIIERATRIFFRSFQKELEASQAAVAFLENAVTLLDTPSIHKAYLVYDKDCNNYRNLMSHEDLLNLVKKEWLLIKLKTHYSKRCLFFVMSGLS